jgi:ABC-2 type transport system permease protein
MSNLEKLRSLFTILRKEMVRFFRIYIQTFISPAIVITLYFIIFGNLIGSRIGQMGGFNYVQFMAPGLILMSVITNSYGNVVSSFFNAKFTKSIEELLVTPIPNHIILTGWVAGGVARGLLVGVVVTAISLFFTEIIIENIALTVLAVVLTSILFSLLGFLNAFFAETFDHISIVPNFVLTPLIYLGGVFYSIHLLPEFWKNISLVNPLMYMINAFRHGMLGTSDLETLGFSVNFAIFMMIFFITIIYSGALWLLNSGRGIRS